MRRLLRRRVTAVTERLLLSSGRGRPRHAGALCCAGSAHWTMRASDVSDSARVPHLAMLASLGGAALPFLPRCRCCEAADSAAATDELLAGCWEVAAEWLVSRWWVADESPLGRW